MPKYIKRSLMLLGCLGATATSMYVAYRAIAPTSETEAPIEAASEAQMPQAFSAVGDDYISTAMPLRINANTWVIYEYLYTQDGRKEITQGPAPYFMLDMSQERMEETFLGWDIISFSPEEVTIRRTINEVQSQYYIVGEQNGYVAVFYRDPIHGPLLKETTSTLVNNLPPHDQMLLKEGLHVSEEQLMKVLEDLSS